ncbi:hypothetical protein EDB89DRAFT_1909184 [Lactarius sanguifluus]|nr:hypothetical protein EDB89DRAFT_1909184 [Lactarius sanguifluus]
MLDPGNNISMGLLMRNNVNSRDPGGSSKDDPYLKEKEQFSDRVPTTIDQFNAVVQCEQLLELVRKMAGLAVNNDDYQALLQYDAFWVASSSSRPQPEANECDERIVSEESQGKAVVDSWTAKFIGKGPLQTLEKHIHEQMMLEKRYACYCSIVQSSGMGKSCLLDEFSKQHFLIPINLCLKDGGGFSLPMMKFGYKTIKKINADYTPSKGNAKTKRMKLMLDGHTMDSCGPQRANFSHEVVKQAESSILSDIQKNKSKSDEKCGRDLINAFEDLLVEVNDDASLFTFFLSTTSKISQFSPPCGCDNSNHMNDGELITPTPFIYLGFDHLMRDCKVFNKYKTLDDVTSLECIAHMGRPLWGTTYDHGNEDVRCGLVHFASLKLLCGMFPDKLSEAQNRAVLSQRLPLDINGMIYAPLPSNQVEKEQEQISNHMHVCMSIGDGINTICGIAASEPILVEVASIVMSDWLSKKRSCKKVAKTGCRSIKVKPLVKIFAQVRQSQPKSFEIWRKKPGYYF